MKVMGEFKAVKWQFLRHERAGLLHVQRQDADNFWMKNVIYSLLSSAPNIDLYAHLYNSNICKYYKSHEYLQL